METWAGAALTASVGCSASAPAVRSAGSARGTAPVALPNYFHAQPGPEAWESQRGLRASGFPVGLARAGLHPGAQLRPPPWDLPSDPCGKAVGRRVDLALRSEDR